jgi:quinol monooxygenase YgiN
MIRLNVFIQAAAGNASAIVEVSKELVAASLKDEGCVAYDIFTSATRDDVMMICETWRDAEALSAHEATAHFTTLVPKLQTLGSLKIEKFEF